VEEKESQRRSVGDERERRIKRLFSFRARRGRRILLVIGQAGLTNLMRKRARRMKMTRLNTSAGDSSATGAAAASPRAAGAREHSRGKYRESPHAGKRKILAIRGSAMGEKPLAAPYDIGIRGA